ncbi:MAG: HI0074 family nucleotidyltransferase substrate-binding subunit, partial [Clostridia bacterium]
EEKLDRKDLRCIQFKDAIISLKQAINKDFTKLDITIKIDSVIHRFEYTFELMLKTLRDYFLTEGFIDDLDSPRSVLKFAFKNNIISNEKVYLIMLEQRNSTVHLYSETKEIYDNICNSYIYRIDEIYNFLKLKKYIK